jgi:hypothetical protein
MINMFWRKGLSYLPGFKAFFLGGGGGWGEEEVERKFYGHF